MLNNPKSEALRRVRHLIKTNQETFICFALERVGLDSPTLAYACEKLRLYVVQSLSPYDVLQTWQERNDLGDRGADQRRADRLAWIDWMLEESPNASG